MDEKTLLLTALIVIRIVSVDTHRWQALGRHPDNGIGGCMDLICYSFASSLHPKMAGGGLLYGGVQ
jgi:hypothetical protein